MNWQAVAMNFILNEIRLTKPDVVLFFTGPNYDDLLLNVFDDIQFRSVSDKSCRQLAVVSSKYLPEKSLRTYHPGYLWRIDFNSYLNDILDVIAPKN